MGKKRPADWIPVVFIRPVWDEKKQRTTLRIFTYKIKDFSALPAVEADIDRQIAELLGGGDIG